MDHPIKVYRKRRGLTLAGMGAVLGVRKSAIFKWEHGIGPSPARAIDVERITDGELHRWDLRPDLWAPPQEVAP